METRPTLYKRTVTGAIQQWHMEIDGTKYRTVSGQVDGKLVTSEWTTAEGKNVGRSNETTAEDQAKAEVDSRYTIKLNQGGYHESIDDVDKPKHFKPMLAKKYEDYVPDADTYANGEVVSQPKLDGIRCIATAEGLYSRQGKPIVSVPHIMESLQPMFDADPDLILDGELYASKFAEDFNEIVSLAKKTKPKPEDLEAARVIEYWVYDCPGIDGTFSERYDALQQIVDVLNHPNLVLVPTTTVKDEEHLDEIFETYINDGMEGQMLRFGNSPYENKRSKFLLKRKDFVDEEFEVVEVCEGKGNRSGMAGYITYRLQDGRTFNSSIRGGVAFYRQLLENKDDYVGGQGTVRYFHMTPDGVPRFPVTVALFEGKRDV